MRLGVLGGTFDPVHVGHLLLAECAREELGLERVLWVPAGAPWRKAGRALSPAAQRLEMVRRAVDGNAAFEVATTEVEKDGPSYSVETLWELNEQDPRRELFLLLGMDALEDLPNWKEPARIIELARLAVALRGEERLPDERLEGLVPGLARRVEWLHMPRVDVSATEIRERAAAGRTLRYVVPDEVEAYIHEQRLYRRN